MKFRGIKPQPVLEIPTIKELEFHKMIGKRIQDMRKAAGILVRTMADAVGAEYSVYHRWEKGDTRMNAYQIAMVAAALDVSVSELMTIEEATKANGFD